jgi:8-oxo-dGTP pyrophosphatase MutT (NUDIX family)
MDHVKAGLWLPPGGHVEPDEHPRETVRREMLEELNVSADFSTPFADRPLFITTTVTQGQGQHTDVSLWYVVALSSRNEINYDAREFNGYRWLTFDEVAALPLDTIDPEMHRFTAKLRAKLAG